MTNWLTTGDVAETLGRTSESVRIILEKDRERKWEDRWLPGGYRTPGGHWRIPHEALAALLSKLGIVRRAGAPPRVSK